MTVIIWGKTDNAIACATLLKVLGIGRTGAWSGEGEFLYYDMPNYLVSDKFTTDC